MFLVLHGQTEWNAAGRLQGRSDSPLTEFGRVQSARCAARLLEHLPRAPKAAIVSSPLGRTRQTAKILAQHLEIAPDAITIEPRIAELHLGSWEGLTREQIVVRWPKHVNPSDKHNWLFGSPDGESYDAVAARLNSWLDELEDHRALIVVSHGVASRVLQGLFAGLSRVEALALPIRRDTVLRLSDHRIEDLTPP